MTKDTVFCSVCTPSVFRELEVAADEAEMTPAQRRALNRLADLAERHGTRVEFTSYRRG